MMNLSELTLVILISLHQTKSIASFIYKNTIPSKYHHHHHHHKTRLKSLRKSGESFVSLSRAVVPSLSTTPDQKAGDNNELANAFRSIGESLLSAHDAFTEEWDEVTVALHAASEFFDVLSVSRARRHRTEDSGDDNDNNNNIGKHNESELYGQIAQELRDASEISGCLSIGPPAAVPNFEAVKDCLLELARLEDVYGTDLATLFREAADGFAGLIQDTD